MDLRTSRALGNHDLHIGAPVAADGQGVRIELTGELDGANATPLIQALTVTLADPMVGSVELDTSGLTFVDSCGIRTLLLCRTAAEDSGRRLRLIDPSPPLRQVLTITGLLELFGLEPEPQSASPDPAFPWTW